MAPIALGRLATVDLCEVFKSEANDFTPWLAQAENLALLADVIGIDFALETTERAVGPCRADILCKDTVTGNYVLIENQLDWTDQAHLGQLLTCSAGLNAATIVWIARKFTPEHRVALDWLNASTRAGLDFFGLEIELWQIGDSQRAPKFNVVCQPNNWRRRVAEPVVTAAPVTEVKQPNAPAPRTESAQMNTSTPVREVAQVDTPTPVTPTPVTELTPLYLQYWAEFREYLLNSGAFLKARQPYAEQWADFEIGRTGFGLRAWLSIEQRYIDTSVVLAGDDATAHFKLLGAQKAGIEKELGPLVWVELPEKKSCTISQLCPILNSSDRKQWPAQFAWLKARLEAFHHVFAPRIQALQLASAEPDIRAGVSRPANGTADAEYVSPLSLWLLSTQSEQR